MKRHFLQALLVSALLTLLPLIPVLLLHEPEPAADEPLSTTETQPVENKPAEPAS